MYGKQGGFVSSRSRSRLVFWLWMLAVVLVQFGCNQSQPTEKLDDEPALSREHTEKVLEKDNPRVNRAVVIGINNYGEGFKQLKRAVNDARGIRNILVDEFGYDSTFVTLLENQSASLSRVKNTLTQMSQSLDANDTILFFFAGHGGRVGWSEFIAHQLYG